MRIGLKFPQQNRTTSKGVSNTFLLVHNVHEKLSLNKNTDKIMKREGKNQTTKGQHRIHTSFFYTDTSSDPFSPWIVGASFFFFLYSENDGKK